MNIAVIGSGATAFGVLLKLKEKLGKSDIKITILSKDLNFMNKIFADNVNDKKTKFGSNFNKDSHSKIRHNFGHTFGEIPIKNSDNLIYDVPFCGGLSDLWSGFAALPMDQNLNKWGIKKSEIDPCYKNIAEKLLSMGATLELTVLEDTINFVHANTGYLRCFQ